MKTLSISMEPKSFKSFYEELSRVKKSKKKYSKYKMFQILHDVTEKNLQCVGRGKKSASPDKNQMQWSRL